MRKFLIAILFLSLCSSMAQASAIQGDGHPLWRLVSELEHSMPFRKGRLEELLHLKISSDQSAETKYAEFMIGSAGDYAGVRVDDLDLRIDKTLASKPAWLSIEISPSQCTSLKGHYKDPPIEKFVVSPHANNPGYNLYLVFRRPWGQMTFEIDRKTTSKGYVDCVIGMIFEPDDYKSAIQSRE